MHSNNVELTSQSSNSDQVRLYQAQSSTSGPLYPNYSPQIDEDSQPEPPSEPPISPQRPQESRSAFSRILKHKCVNLPLLFILCFYIINIPPFCASIFYFFKKIGLSIEMHDTLSKTLQSMSKDLKADPIMEIILVDRGSICPSGYEILKLATWPGTVESCLCDDGDLHRTPCERVDAPGCRKELPKSLPIDMYEWDGSIFCVKRAVEGSEYLRKAECDRRFRECYPGGCFVGGCPVTHVEISSTRSPYKFNNHKEDNKYLVARSVKGDPPLINLQMTFGDIPCFTQEDLFSQTIKNSTYIFSATKKNRCDKCGLDSQSSTKLASQTAYDSFTQNYLPKPVMDLPYFRTNANKTTSILSSKVRMKTAHHDYCQAIDAQPMNDYIEAFPLSAILSFLCSLFILLLQIACIFIITCYRASHPNDEFFEDPSQLVAILSMLSVVSLVPLIILFVNFYRICQAFEVAKEYFEGYYSLECFAGGQGQMVISDNVEILNSVSARFWIYMVLLVSNVLSGLMCIWLCIAKKTSRAQA